MIRTIITIFCTLLIASFASAQELSNIPASFLNIGFGARGLGMGGAYHAATDDVHSIVWNPAGLSAMKRSQMTFSFTKQFGLIPYYFVAAGGPFESSWAHGEALIVSGDEAMHEMRAIGSIAKAFQRYVPGLRLGTTFELRHASYGRQQSDAAGQIMGEAFGFSIGIGAQYDIWRKITLALVMRDIINMMNWNSSGKGSYSEGVPMTFFGGIAVKNVKEFTIDVDFEKSLHWDTSDRICLGAEREIFQYFVLRGGISVSEGYSETQVQYAAGSGLRNFFGDRFFLDFTYLFHDFNNSFRMSFLFQK
ncbi:hypothetical protein JXJ21_11690 [candidate division KSB1 bacterium]|nr:hypothetical protein [candidate division KSB1 bacterium]